jgi:hypothetical protein
MIKAFNGTTLSHPLVFENEWHSSKIKQEMDETIGGGVIIYEQERISGTKIKLINYEGGFLNKLEVDTIVGLARTLNKVVTITDDLNNVVNCRFNHLDGGVVATPKNPKSNYYDIEINLIRV